MPKRRELLKALLITGAAFLLHGCASPNLNETYESPTGTWRTKIQISTGAWLPHGVMEFSDGRKVTYSFHNGRIHFNDVNNQGKWKGHWVEDTWGGIYCSDERDGSRTWGEAIFKFDETFNTYTGIWDKCGDGKPNPWIGKRI